MWARQPAGCYGMPFTHHNPTQQLAVYHAPTCYYRNKDKDNIHPHWLGICSVQSVGAVSIATE